MTDKLLAIFLIEDQKDILNRIRNYLTARGLFNPEMMGHNMVRDLLIDCEEFIRLLIIKTDQ